ncbi:MAG: AzlD domain-containing protein, partial [Candidatus Puniceispirillales bacterium]
YRICGRNAGRISGRTIQNKGGQIMIWVAIFISGILTFMMRFAFIGSLAHRQIPPPIRSMLSYVSTAVLTAIIVSDVLIVDTVVSINDNPKIPALILAGIAALLFRNVMITISIGLVTLWGLNTYF